ncbi:MAG: hypothetical protein DDT20_01626 [Firmicutes bacterium]|nr:hypothetical protein [Bacillota bacterium]
MSMVKVITTEEGIMLRTNRSIQVEGAFAVLKQDMGFRRFLLRGRVKVETEINSITRSKLTGVEPIFTFGKHRKRVLELSTGIWPKVHPRYAQTDRRQANPTLC